MRLKSSTWFAMVCIVVTVWNCGIKSSTKNKPATASSTRQEEIARKVLSNTVDLNKDGILSCIDNALLFRNTWHKETGNWLPMVYVTDGVDAHLFVRIGDEDIEPTTGKPGRLTVSQGKYRHSKAILMREQDLKDRGWM